MGTPGLAFETWDPSNQFPLETPILLFVLGRACDFFDLSVFGALDQVCFSPWQNCHPESL
jgi:hypothetical protein